MSYLRKIEYTIKPEESFEILRNCSGCGCKTAFHNTNCFRVNANGNKIDVWLIYQCRKCKHTNNLTVYERCRPEAVLQEEYDGFLSNSSHLALEYGTDSQFFSRNRAEVDWSNIKYRIDGHNETFDEGDLISVSNIHALKIRTDKVLSEILGVTRAVVKRLEKSGIIRVIEEKQEHRISIEIKGDLNCESIES